MKLQKFLTNYIDTVPLLVLVASILLFFHFAPPLLKILGPGQNEPFYHLAFELPLGFVLIVVLLCVIFTVNTILYSLLRNIIVKLIMFTKSILSL